MSDALPAQSARGSSSRVARGARASCGLSIDRRVANAGDLGADDHLTVTREIKPATWAAAQSYAWRHGRQPAALLVATFVALIARLSGNEENTVDVYDRGGHRGLTATVGSATDMHALAETVSGSASDDLESMGPVSDAAICVDVGTAESQGYLVAVSCMLDERAPRVELTYDSRAWLTDRAEAVVDQFVGLLDLLVAAPGAPVMNHSLITDRTRGVLPDVTSAIKVQRYAPVFDTVEMIGTYSGDSIAVRHRGRNWTYRQLMEAAQGIGRELVARGCERGDPIAVRGGNSFGLVATLLGVWYAGGVAVPIDPQLPEHRREVMCDTAKVAYTCALEDGSAAAAAAQSDRGDDTVSIDPDSGWVRSARAPADVPLPIVSDQDLAYIIFTSGSTGTPKGVLGYHGGLSHFLEWQRDRFDIGAGDRGAQLTTVGFDVVLRSIFLPLISGATVVLPEADAVDASAILPWIVREEITYTHLVPSVAAAWLSEGQTVPLPALRRVFFAGEPLADGLVTDWRRCFSDSATVINLYGPTETTLAKCFNVLGRELRPGTAPIGNGIPGSQLLILNEDRPCGVGEVGEIVIRTPYRSRGYVREDGLDTTCFVPNPFTSDPADLLYRTGDLGRFLPDGELEILGRRDAQVKIHGVRIELGEIETLLRHQPGVTAAAVALRPVGDEPVLVGYLVAEGDVDTAAIERALVAELPRSMHPSAFVVLPELPRTSSGKIDRRALPDPPESLTGEVIAATTQTERTILGIWCEVLKRDTISVDADFFAIGGHSIRAVRVASRISRAFNVHVTLAEVFEQSTIARLANHVDALVSAADEQPVAGQSPPLEHLAERPHWLLSNAQRRMWFLQQLDPRASTYNVSRAFDVRGTLDVDALAKALVALVERHDVLRTAVDVDEEGDPIAVPLPTERIDVLTHVKASPSETGRSVAELTAEFVRRPFDLASEYPIRALLVSSESDEYRFVLVIHHIATDGWSSAQLIGELSANYTSLLADRVPDTRPVGINYADFAAWEQHVDTEPEADLTYWKERLDGITRLELPHDFPVRAQSSARRGATYSMKLSSSVNDQFRAREGSGITAFSATLAAFTLQLGQLCGTTDVSVGTPSSGRTQPELDQTIGFFSNTLVLRNQIPADGTFRSLAQEVQRSTAEAMSHQTLPFERLVDRIDPDRGSGGNPLFDVMFACGYSDPDISLPGAQVSAVEIETGAAHFELMLTVSLGPTDTQLQWEYDRDRFDETTIRRFARHYEDILARAMADTSVGITEATSLAEGELTEVEQWSAGTVVEYPAKTIPELIFDVAAGQPDRPAVIGTGMTLDYAELARRALDVAAALQSAGVQRGDIVGVCCERGPASVTALLGVWCSGAVYTPINPAYPDNRLESIFETATPRLTLVDDVNADRLTNLDVTTLELSSIAAIDGCEPRWPLPDDVSYLIFTSGSTGKPKGVEQTHRTLMNLTNWQGQELPPVAGRHVALFSSFGFDVSLQEMSYTLASGGELHVTPADARSDASAFWDFVEDHRIELIFMPTAALDAVCDRETLADPVRGASLNAIVVAGEALKITPRIRSVFSALPQCKLINQYGPSETHVVTSAVLAGHAKTWPYLPTIGGLIDNTTAYILDRNGELVPRGAVGELFIGGDPLARGYYGRADLTAERFAEHSIRSADALVDIGRLYRTGDLVRLTNSGDLEFRGRADSQVKLRGHRVELGEIESRLADMAAVQQAVVQLRTDDDDQFLVCYLVASVAQEINVDDVAHALSSQLPDYMIPEAFVVVPAIPLNANGKVSTADLPVPERTRRASTTEYAAPRTEVEKDLVGLFAEVVHVARVGIDDDFFELGGHSLRAAALAARARSELGYEITLRELFAHSTVRQIAEYLALTGTLQAGHETRKLVHEPDLPAPLSSPQERVWLVQEMGVDPRSYVVPVGMLVDGPLDTETLDAAFRALVARHDVLRTRVVNTDADPIQVVDAPEPHITYIDVSTEPDTLAAARVAILAAIEEPFDPGVGPLIRALCIRLEPQRHVLVEALHHLIADGGSIPVLTRDLTELYAAIRGGRRPVLPPLRFCYRDWARWQQEQRQGPTVKGQLEYWRAELSDAPAETELPFDRPRPAHPSYAGGDVEFELSGGVVDALRALAREHKCSLVPILSAAFGALISRCGGQEEVLLGMPVDARTPELEDLVGFFVRTVALKVDLAGDPTFNDLVARTWQHHRLALVHQDVPFDDIVRDLAPVRVSNRNPIFQTMVVLEDASEQTMLELEGLQVSRFPIKTDYSSFDLTWFIRNEGDRMTTTMKYSKDLFDRSTIERLASRLSRLLEDAVAHADRPLSVLELFDETEREVVLVEWNDTARHYDNEGTIHGLFEDQVDRTPTAVAVRQEGRRLTYAELDGRSNELAEMLIERGVGPEQRVAICLPRSIEALVCVFAVLKSGAAYVPLDPSHPKDRREHILNDCGAALLLTTAEYAGDVSAPCVVIEVDGCAVDDGQARARPMVNVGPSNASYVIYTSGSTGKPKGVVIEHRSARNYVNWCVDAYRTDSGFGSPWLSSLSFDLTVTSIFPVLSVGGYVDVIAAGAELDARSLAAVRNASLIKLTPAHMAIVADSLAPEDAASWTHDAIIGGEALEAETLTLWKEYAPETRLINEYGPTETTVGCTVYDAAKDSRSVGAMPIGRPIANMTVYVLDGRQSPVGIGVVGELWIGGVGVARGYLGREDLTREKFVPDPFSSVSGARMYRSGDLARWRADGILEYLGRADEQVKLRGYRIELGDIEAKLRDCDGVHDAVTALKGSGTSAFLAAYVVPDDAVDELDLVEVRRHIGRELPDYMMPTTIDVIPLVPLSPAGKVDRRLLPEPERQLPADSFRPPRTRTELQLTLIWERLLQVSPIGADDDFFELGGHSLAVARLIGAIDREFGAQIPAQAVFSTATLSALAAQIDQAGPRRPLDVLVPLRDGGPKTPLFCIHPAGGHVFGFVALAGRGDPERPFIAIQCPNLDPEAVAITDVPRLAARYVAEIRSRQPDGPYLLAGWSFGGVVAYEVANQLQAAGQEVALLCMFDSYLPSSGKIRQLMSNDELLESARKSEQVVGAEDSADLAAMERTYLGAIEMLFRYEALPYSGRVVILQAAESDDLYDVRAADTWESLITPPPEIREIPGDHHSMMREPNVDEVAAVLDDVLGSL